MQEGVFSLFKQDSDHVSSLGNSLTTVTVSLYFSPVEWQLREMASSLHIKLVF